MSSVLSQTIPMPALTVPAPLRWLVLVALLMSGCTAMPSAETPRTQGAPVTADTELSGSPALALLERAGQARQQGRDAAAGRYLERALTMAPNSSWLYRELALLRLEEGDPAAAEGLARRALRLAPDNDDYRADLWELVAAARAELNDPDGADAARARAEKLRRGQA